MKTIKTLLALFVVFCLAVPVFAHDDEDDDEEIARSVVGVWVCTAIRPTSGVFRLIHNFHDDGTMNYSSGSDLFDVDGTATLDPGYSSRGGGHGEWAKVGPNLYRYKAIENLWENLDEDDPNGNRDKLAGAFYVDSTFYHDPGSDTHCSGTSTSEPDASCDGIVPDALRDDVVTVLRRIGTLNNPIPGYSDNATVPPAANVSYKCIRLGEHLESIP